MRQRRVGHTSKHKAFTNRPLRRVYSLALRNVTCAEKSVFQFETERDRNVLRRGLNVRCNSTNLMTREPGLRGHGGIWHISGGSKCDRVKYSNRSRKPRMSFICKMRILNSVRGHARFTHII